MISGNI